MTFTKKRQVGAQRRVVQEKWRHLYFSVEQNDKQTCLICTQQISVPKEYNIQQRYGTHVGSMINILGNYGR